MINSDYRPVELGLAKPVIYARLSHPEHSGKGSETRGIQGAKHRPPGRLHVGADEAGGGPCIPVSLQFPVLLVFTPKHRSQAAAGRSLLPGSCGRSWRGGGWGVP